MVRVNILSQAVSSMKVILLMISYREMDTRLQKMVYAEKLFLKTTLLRKKGK